MDVQRLARYAEKLAHASDRLAHFDEWAPDARDDLRSRLAAYKAFQEASEALADVVAMLVKDNGRAPRDDYGNLDLLADGALTEPAIDALREANGLRNRLVHEYDGLTDSLALESGQRLTGPLEQAIGEVRDWLSKQP